MYEKLDLIVKSGAKVVLSKLPIGDVATQVIRNPDSSFGRCAIDFHISYLNSTCNINTNNSWLLVFC